MRRRIARRGSGITKNGDESGTNIIGNVTLGADALTNPTAASTNITLGTSNSVFRLYTPITPLYSYPVGAGQIGYPVASRADNGVSVTARLYAPISNLPNGVYVTHMYLYNYTAPSPTTFYAVLAYSNGAISNGQEYYTGTVYDGAHEMYGTQHRQNTGWCMKGGGVYVVTNNSNRHIAIRAWTIDSASNETVCVIILQATRIA